MQESSVDFEASLVAKFDELISIIQRRKEQLIHQVIFVFHRKFSRKMLLSLMDHLLKVNIVVFLILHPAALVISE